MKKFFMIMMLATLAVGLYAGEKAETEDKTNSDKVVKVDFNGKWVKSYIAKKRCDVKDGVLSLSGKESDKNNSWRSVVYSLKFKDPGGKKFKFGGEIKGENIKGSFRVGVRLINSKGKSITYIWHSIKKDQDWKEFSSTFTAKPETVKMQFYFLASKMGDDSVGSIKNIYIEEL